MTSFSARGPPAWASLAILGAAAAYLHRRWDDLPVRWVVHWGPAGNPNGWTGRDWQGVYGLLLLGLLVWALLEGIAAAVRAQARVYPDTEAATIATLPFLRWVSVAISVVLAYLSIDLPLGQPEPRNFLPVVALLMAGGIGTGIVHSALAVARARREGSSNPPPGHHGVYYAKGDDKRLLVPRLSGLGLTLNFSHPLAWPILLLLLAAPLVLVAVTLKLAH